MLQFSAEIDECASNPCENGATCNNLVGSFTCACVLGFEDVTCGSTYYVHVHVHCSHLIFQLNEKLFFVSANIDDCANTPCANGAQCVDEVNGFTCQCESGYTGSSCDGMTTKSRCSVQLHDFHLAFQLTSTSAVRTRARTVRLVTTKSLSSSASACPATLALTAKANKSS